MMEIQKDDKTENLKKELIEIYEGYIKDNKNKDIKDKAQKIFMDYTYSSSITDRALMEAIWGLEHIGYDYPRGSQKGEWKLSELDAKKILEKLK